MLFPCLGGDFDMLLYGKFANLGGGLIMTVYCHVHDDCDITIVMNNVLRENMMAPRSYLDEYLGTMNISSNKTTRRTEIGHGLADVRQHSGICMLHISLKLHWTHDVH